MADVVPFRALRYDPARVPLASVVTQPYDKITPAMQDRYYAASEYNLVRIILGKPQADDHAGDNVYTRAADAFRLWRAQRVLVPDPEPAFYLYSQRFAPPGGGAECERRGFIGLGRLEDYSAGVVFRHEQTLSGPKKDRLELLRATRAHFGQIFMLYSDPQRRIEQRLPIDTPPQVEVRDEYGVLHRVWPIAAAADVAFVGDAMREQKLIIADGHHRYETALAYRDQRRAAAGATGADAPYERVMMTFVNTESEGLLVLPTHRVVFGLDAFDSAAMLRDAAAYFDVHAVKTELDPDAATALLAQAGSGHLLAVTAHGATLLAPRPGAADELLAAFSPQQRALDVVQLHKIMLEQVLGISEETIRAQTNLRYLRDAGEALAAVRSGANVAFLMNPVSAAQVRDIALAGQVLPQKSTDFYPKLLSGLTIYALE